MATNLFPTGALILAAIADGECLVKKPFAMQRRDVHQCAVCENLGQKLLSQVTRRTLSPLQRPRQKPFSTATTAALRHGFWRDFALGLGVDAKFVGDQSLSRRPMARVLQPLSQMGARFATGKGMLFECFHPAFRVPRYVRCSFGAGKKRSTFGGTFRRRRNRFHGKCADTQPHGKSLLHTGASLQVHGKGNCIQKSRPHSFEISLPNDFSSVAYLIALCLLSGQQKVFCNVCVNERRVAW